MNRTTEGLPQPKWAKATHHLVQYRNEDGVVDHEKEIDKDYWGHSMTGLAEDKLENEEETTVRSLAALLKRGKNHIQNRVYIEEYYDTVEAVVVAHKPQQSSYRQPVHLLISFWKLRVDKQEPIGDKT